MASYQKEISVKNLATITLLQENSNVSRKVIRRRIIKEYLIEYKCAICGNDGYWCDSKVELQLDHINGIANDNRLENLRFLCPNCHSQTDTYCGKNLKNSPRKHVFKKCKPIKVRKIRVKKNKNQCIVCGKKISRRAVKCRSCFSKLVPRKSKINWPEDMTLLNLVNQSNYLHVAKQLGVSDNAVKKRLKRQGLLIYVK